MALRALVLVLVIATFIAAGGERMRRIAAAFDWQGVMTPANFRIDAWVSPPNYTGKPPLILPGLRPGEPVPAAATFAVPVGSTLIVRGTGHVRLDVAASGGLTEPKPGDPKPGDLKSGDPKTGSKLDPKAATRGSTQANAASGAEERRFTIGESGSATVRGGANDVTWQFTAIPDRPPTIALAKDPEAKARGALQLSYKLEDDYGVVEAHATFGLKDGDGEKAQAPHPLFDAPDFPLILPQARTRNGVGQTTKDLTEHPWAGADVAMTLTARDEAGNEGKSAPFELRLPERTFTNPLARALVEQRRILALDAEAQPRVLTALDALSIAPDRFNMQSGPYLGLQSIFWSLARAKNDDALRDVVARMWDMALSLENGTVSDAEQALRAAEEALRQALERGASDDEIKRLTDQLRAALDKFLQALAEQLRQNPQQLARPLDPNARMVRPQDLNAMIDRLEQMARSGARDAARRMLQELQSMLENLQTARPGQMQNDDDDDMASALDQLGDMIRRQQQLRDRTFQQGQDARRDRQQRGQGRQQQGDPNAMNGLRQDQQALRDQLNKLLEEMRKRGMGQPGQQGSGELDQLGRAGEAMGEAEGDLGEGNADGAVDSQGRALEALRQGAQGLAQAMQQQGDGPGNGRLGRLGRPRSAQETDPLGRPRRGDNGYDNDSVNVPGEIDVQRARRILEELRRRFGEAFRPQLELDYIERLLKDY
jgi:uncharacterized protein (TIGR02302 family)